MKNQIFNTNIKRVVQNAFIMSNHEIIVNQNSQSRKDLADFETINTFIDINKVIVDDDFII